MSQYEFQPHSVMPVSPLKPVRHSNMPTPPQPNPYLAPSPASSYLMHASPHLHQGGHSFGGSEMGYAPRPGTPPVQSFHSAMDYGHYNGLAPSDAYHRSSVDYFFKLTIEVRDGIITTFVGNFGNIIGTFVE